MAVCGVHLIVQHLGERVRVFHARCKCWECDDCSKFRVSALRKEVLAGEPELWMTLTCVGTEGADPHKLAVMMNAAFERLVKRIKRYKKLKSLHYFLTVEKTKRGFPHFNVFMRGPYIDQGWLSEQWRELTGAWNVDIRKIRDARQATHYVTKYITKAVAKFGRLKRFRRSQKWRKIPKPTPKHGWKGAATRTLKFLSLATYITVLQQKGFVIESAENGAVIALKPSSGCDPPLWDCAVEQEPLPKRQAEVRNAA